MQVLSAFVSILMFMFIVSVSCTKHIVLKSDTLCPPEYPEHGIPIYKGDIDMMQFPENLEHLEADYFLWSALGYGLDYVAPELVMGGPLPIGAQKANLDFLTRKMIEEFGYQEVGHLRALKTTFGGFPRPLMDLSAKNFAKVFDQAFGYKLVPPFDPYRNSLSFMLASYVIPYVGLLGYVGTNPFLIGARFTLSGADFGRAIGGGSRARCNYKTLPLRTSGEVVHPYNHTVAEFTIQISKLRNRLARCGIRDEGIIVPPWLGAENRTESNVLSADYNSLSYGRSPREVLRMVYGTGNEHVPSAFFPKGGNGRIAKSF
ncbi:Desiccation-related protein PCC13-62 [Sesamum angolense]|uniref:Desiccation-related protein PCC13-62 n=1 Tax=Sesamum angolense TaxID=2727404 RepID=A0AAE1T4P7_9LAMI|nr:Desiccation-related protein PCC13-62 [Sesamum angolense]